MWNLRARTIFCTGVGVTALSVPSCGQPLPVCVSGRGNFAALYQPISASDPAGSCAGIIGEVLGMNTYNYPSMGEGTGDWKRGRVAIQGARMGARVARQERSDPKWTDPDPLHRPYALGDFTSGEPASDDFCRLGSVADAVQSFPVAPRTDMEEEAPAKTLAYKWNNAAFYVTTAALGTQMVAELEYVKDDCTAKYEVWAMAPDRDCERIDKDEQGKWNKRSGEPDPRRCLPPADPDNGIADISGVSPDFPVECKSFASDGKSNFHCVLTARPPALK
jgi:hypothetical protein